jgi:RsiW-degrading membrane proteinase PrsW (M82 family)
VLLVGGFISMFVAGLINMFSGVFLGVESDICNKKLALAQIAILYYLLVAVNEELVKFYVTWLLIRRSRHFNEPADAIVYAMTAALGFAVFENIQYGMEYGNWVVIIRQINATPLHLGLAALWGIGMAKTKFGGNGSLLITSSPYLLSAMVIHAVYNILLTYKLSPNTGIFIATTGAVVLVWQGVRRIRKYSDEGPFSKFQRCENCGTQNLAIATRCKKCEELLNHTNQFSKR